MNKLQETIETISALDEGVMAKVKEHIDQLTKPVGSLGRIEELAIQLSGITKCEKPSVKSPVVIIAAADHGIVEEGVSAYPQEVTKLMILNFLQGGAAINVFAKQINARVQVVDIGVKGDIAHPNIIVKKIKHGTNNFLHEDAMTIEEATHAIEAGIQEAERLITLGHKLIIIGEMGIGNTSSSSALVSAFTGVEVECTVGRGTGIDTVTHKKKIDVIKRAIENRGIDITNPLETLAKIGGLEIAFLTGVILAAASKRVPVIIDGLISSAAAIVASQLAPLIKNYFIISHQSTEPGHDAIFSFLNLTPLLSLHLRLGEGTGAALAYPLLEAATGILTDMATFSDLGIEKKEVPID